MSFTFKICEHTECQTSLCWQTDKKKSPTSLQTFSDLGKKGYRWQQEMGQDKGNRRAKIALKDRKTSDSMKHMHTNAQDSDCVFSSSLISL